MLLRWILFLLTFFVLATGVAPTIAPGPTGTITLTVGSGGNSPPTGYTLFSISARLMDALVPFGEMAWRFHLTSALMTAIALMLLVFSSEILKALIFNENKRRQDPVTLVLLWVLIFSTLLYSEAVARITYFSDRYSTSAAVASLLLFLLVQCLWKLKRAPEDLKSLNSLVFATVLSGVLIVHAHMSLVPFSGLVVLSVLFLYFRAYKSFPWKHLIFAALLGLLPFIYLPWNASYDPLFNWGNVDSWEKFWFYVTRTEYGHLPEAPSFDYYRKTFFLCVELLWHQFHLSHILLIFVSFAVLFKASWRWLSFLVVAIFLTGFLLPLIWVWPLEAKNSDYLELLKNLLVKYLSPAYFILAGLVGLGFIVLKKNVHQNLGIKWEQAVTAFGLFLGLVLGGMGYLKHQKSAYYLSHELVHNAEVMIPEGSVVITQFDSCFSALSYYQIHQSRFKNRVIVHSNLIYRSWYVSTLEKLYPDFYLEFQDSLESLKQTALHIEQGDSSFSSEIQQKQTALMKDVALKKEGVLYLCPEAYFQDEREWKQRGFSVEPLVYFYRLSLGSHGLNKVPLEDLKFEKSILQASYGDYWSRGILKKTAFVLKQRSRIYKILDPKYYQKLSDLEQRIQNQL